MVAIGVEPGRGSRRVLVYREGDSQAILEFVGRTAWQGNFRKLARMPTVDQAVRWVERFRPESEVEFGLDPFDEEVSMT